VIYGDGDGYFLSLAFDVVTCWNLVILVRLILVQVRR